MLVFALFLRHVAFECYGCLFCSNAIGQHVMKISMCLIDRLSFFYNHLSHACMLLINWCVLHYYYYMLWTRSVIAQHSFSILLFYTKTELRTVRMPFFFLGYSNGIKRTKSISVILTPWFPQVNLLRFITKCAT